MDKGLGRARAGRHHLPDSASAAPMRGNVEATRWTEGSYAKLRVLRAEILSLYAEVSAALLADTRSKR